MHQLKRTTSDDAGFQTLVTLLDKELVVRDGNEHAFYAQFNKIDALKNVVVYLLDDKPVGCGSFKAYDDTTAEIKRMFVLPPYRGKRIAVDILTGLEQWAAQLNYTACILETGKKQPEAILCTNATAILLCLTMANTPGLTIVFVCVKRFEPTLVSALYWLGII